MMRIIAPQTLCGYGREIRRVLSFPFYGAVLFGYAVIVMVASCSQTRPHVPPFFKRAAGPTWQKCGGLFIQRPYRAVHTITAKMSNGHTEEMIAITLAHPRLRRVRVMLLTVENTILFDGVLDGNGVKISHTIKELSHREFGQGLFCDVAFLNLIPQGDFFYRDREGLGAACLWRKDNGETTEVLRGAGMDWNIRRLSARGHPLKEANIVVDERGVGRTIRLKVHGRRPYSMEMKRISYELLDAETPRGIAIPDGR